MEKCPICSISQEIYEYFCHNRRTLEAYDILNGIREILDSKKQLLLKVINEETIWNFINGLEELLDDAVLNGEKVEVAFYQEIKQARRKLHKNCNPDILSNFRSMEPKVRYQKLDDGQKNKLEYFLSEDCKECQYLIRKAFIHSCHWECGRYCSI